MRTPQSLFASRAARLTLVALVGLLLAGAGLFAVPLLLRGPQLRSATPTNGVADANPQADLRLEFDQPVQANSLADAIKLDPPVELDLSSAGGVVTIRPVGGLAYGANYRLSIDSSLRNLLGRTMAGPETIAFATLPYLAVSSVTPADGSGELPSGAPVTIEFNAPVVSAEQVAAAADDPRLSATLPQPLSLEPAAPGAGQWLSPTRYSYAPANGWSAATTYTLTLQPQLSSDGRARLAQAYRWHFQTAAAVLASTRPFDGQTDVPANGEIELRLARDVQASSTAERFTLTRAGGGQVDGAVRSEQNALFFKPAAPLERGAVYEATIAPGVLASGGAAINQQPLRWSFTVMGDLEVAQVSPPADANEVLTQTKQIAVHFNHPVVAVTTPSEQAALPEALSISPPVKGVGRWLDTSTYVISPTSPLDPATRYRVTVAAGLKDQTGGELRQPFSWTFATLTPQVYGSLPAEGERFFGPTTPLTIVFNQPMDLDSLRGAISLAGPGGASVAGSISLAPQPTEVLRPNPGKDETPYVSGFAVRFTPAAPLERGAAYTLAVSPAAHAATGGVALTKAYSAHFTVAPLPRLIDTNPPNGGQAVPNTQLILTFSTPMDWASVQRNLTITPKPTQIYSSTDQNVLTLYIDLAPESDYSLTVAADARDASGTPMGEAATLRFQTAPLAPSLIMAGSGRIMSYSAYTPVRVPLQTVNLESVSYSLYRIEPSQLAELLTITQNEERWRSFEPPAGSKLTAGSLEPKGARNRTTLALADLGSLDQGAYLFEARAGTATERQLMMVSATTLTIKRSAKEVFVWAVDLATGKPVPELPLQVLDVTGDGTQGKLTTLGRTGADGVLQTALTTTDAYATLFIWSGDGAPFTLGSTNWSNGIDPWSFSLNATQEYPPLVGNLSTDRPIYRPGQLVHVRGVLRLDNDGRYNLPATSQTAKLAISNPEGNTIYSTTLELSPFGSFNADLPLAAGASTGFYSLVASLSDMPDGTAIHGAFAVAEYHKPTFEITVAPTRAEVLQGEQIEATVTARYFAGGILANAPVHWRLLASPFYFTAEDAPGYQFEDLNDAYSSYRWFDQGMNAAQQLVAEGEGRTNAQGQLTVSLPGELGKDHHSRALTLDVEVTDVDGQVIASQGALRLHAGAFYIGLRPDGYVTQAGKPQKVDLLTLSPTGDPVGGRALDVGIYSREWYSVREQGPDGRFYFSSAYTDTLVQNLKATTDAQGRATINFTPATGGSYRIGATGKDDGGREVKASAYTWAYGGDVFWGVNDTNRIDLITDKRSYKPGDTAKILVTAPYAGSSALMTIERGTVLEHRLLSLSGTTQLIEVPISAAHAPNVYVSLVLITPAGAPGSATAPALPDLRMGVVNLPVSTEQQELVVTLTPDKTEVGPRDDVTYNVKTADYSGKGVPAELSLALVDKAVLSLADDANSSLRQSFYERRPLGVFTAQSLTVLADRVTLALKPGSKGGDGMAGGMVGEVIARRDFPDTAYWNATFVTGADGTAKVTLKLPDSLTTWRMTARGVTQATEVGQATTDVIATRPLLVRPALPRFLTDGDEPMLGAVVQNSTNAPLEATVTLEVIGPDNQPAPIQLSDAATQNVSVPANGQAVVRWQASVKGAGNATVRLRVAGGGLNDAMEQPLPIQRYRTPEVAASAGQVIDSTTETLHPPQGASTDGEITLELLPSLGAGVRSGLSYLETYPYAYTEQVVSAFLPNAVSYRLTKELGNDDAALKTALEKNLASGLQRLNALQNLDGGWGWWEGDKSQPYLSAYVVQGLGEALKAGYGIDQAGLDRGIAYLKQALETDADQNQRLPLPTRLNTRAYILFVLNELGQPDRGRSVALFEQRAQLDLYGRAYLLMTLKGLGDDERVRALANDLTASALMRPTDAHWEETRADYWTMSSDTRTTALALQALVRAEPSNVLIPNAVRYLVGLRDHGHWRTTQETAVTLLALSEYVAQSGELAADYRYRVTLNDKPLTDGSVGRDNLTQPINLLIRMADLAQGADSSLTLQRQAGAGQSGKGRLYYTLRMRSYQDAASVQPLDQGVSVQREYALVDTATLSPTGELTTQARLGEIVQVRLTLNIPENMPYFMVEDMLPAGLEPLDTSLKTTSAAARGPAINDAKAEHPAWWYFGRSEVRDNRVALFASDLPQGTYLYTYMARAVTPGHFQTLPATAMRTYAPEVFGRSAGTVFTVTGP